jgi:hypothetical protein
MRYATDPRVNETIERLVTIFDRNPYDWRGEYGDKTVAVVLASVRAKFGDWARTAKITVH